MLGKLNDEQMDYLLRSEVVGRLGCYADGKVYIVPITYVYNGEYIFGHTKEGMKVNMLRNNPSVCFEVDAVRDMANWQSVVIQGVYEELQGDEAQQALRSLINRVTPLTVSETSVPSEGTDVRRMSSGSRAKLVTYRIRVIEKTGRYEKR